MRDIRERPGVHERRRAFQRLHQIGQDGVLHQHGQRAAHAQIVGRDGLARAIAADHHAAQPLPHVAERSGQRQNRHDLAGHGDIEAGDALRALFLGTLADGDLPQHAVVGIHHAPPGDAVRIDIQAREAAALFRRQRVRIGLGDSQLPQPPQHHRRESAAAVLGRRAEPVEQHLRPSDRFVKHARVDGRRQQIVRRGDGVNIAGQMEIELLHGNDLAVAAAGRAAFDAEGRALAGLANAGEHLLAQMRAQRLAQSDRGGGLAFAQRRGSDRGHHDILPVRRILQPIANREMHFGFVLSVQLQFVGKNAGFGAMRSIGTGVAACAISRSLGTGFNRFDSLWGMFCPTLANSEPAF